MCGGSFLGRSLRYRLNVYWKPEGHCVKRKPFCRKETDGLFIAYILNVFLNLFENTVFGRLTRSDNKVWKKLKRPVCVALSYAVIVLILLAITLYVVPEIFKSLELIGETARVNIPVYVDQIAKWADELSKQFNLDFSTMVDSLNNFNWSSIIGRNGVYDELFQLACERDRECGERHFHVCALRYLLRVLPDEQGEPAAFLKACLLFPAAEKGGGNAGRHCGNLEQRVFFLCARPADGVCHFRLPVLHLHVAYRV